jgi:3-hydroxyisobutyrate dehydrogenase-like beta-hydroxyacid dehydrogenase
MTTVGLLHPGAMGASVGAAAAGNGHRVLWVARGRSGATAERANRGGLKPCDSIATMSAEADIILSVCPPHAAEEVARDVSAAGFRGIFVEGNAIAPPRTRRIQASMPDCRFVDGGIIGGPAWTAGAGTRFYLSGSHAREVAALFEGSPLEARVISTEAGAASALKMVFAAYTKGTTALLTAILAVAEAEGVRGELETQWGREFTDRTHRQVTGNTAKAWRFAGEMEEIAATFAGAGLPDGFHLAAAEVFSRLAEFKDTPAEDLGPVLKVLLTRD